MHADPCSEGVSWQLLSGAMHSSGHKNFAGRRSLENLYGLDSFESAAPHRKGLRQDGSGFDKLRVI